MTEFVPKLLKQYRYLSSRVLHVSCCRRLHARVELSTYDARDIIGKFRATVDRCHLQDEQGVIFVN